MNDDTAERSTMPEPDPALRALAPLEGSWEMTGNLVGSPEHTITGRATFRWLPGGFFMEQHVQLDFAGLQIDSLELIGSDPEAGEIRSSVYSNLSPVPLPYVWSMEDRKLTISVQYGVLDATFHGEISEDGTTFSGGWRPNPGADETVNVPYDLTGRRGV